ncbi:probable G-protein coupled receptor 139 [Heptranchias perlo]|uniref:probable G-protein coupled receptor 139 n=1 Tax=Heptranchias perlo TaxID=212740 RepID=UPI00355A4BBA
MTKEIESKMNQKSLAYDRHQANNASENQAEYGKFRGEVKKNMRVNLVAIVILSRGKCGLSKCISRYLVAMAVADLLVIITEVLMWRMAEIFFPQTFLSIAPMCSLNVVFVFATTVISVWLTVTFTFDRFVAISCEKLKAKYCTERTAAVVIGTVSVLGSLKCIPWYFTYEPQHIIGSVPWGCTRKPSFYTSATWAAFELTFYLVTPCLPFVFVLLFNVLTARHILAASRVRRGLRGHSNGEDHKDLEMENRRKSIILLFSISGSFILLWVTEIVFYTYQRITNTYDYSSNDPPYITERAGVMLQLLSSCTNTCIYVLTQNKFREELKNGVKYPLNVIIKFVNNRNS